MTPAAALFEDLERLAQAATPAEVPELLGRTATLEARLRLRLNQPGQPGPVEPGGHDENVDVGEGARRLGMSVRWVYRNAGKLPFAVRLGRRLLLSSRGIDAYLARGPRK